MAARLTDKQKKRIIADYVELGSYRAAAKKNRVSADTVKRIVSSDEEIVQKTTHKKDENTADILAHMETKKATVNQIIDRYLSALLDEERIEKATPSQLTTALGTVIDKFTATAQNEQALQKLDELMDKVGGGI